MFPSCPYILLLLVAANPVSSKASASTMFHPFPQYQNQVLYIFGLSGYYTKHHISLYQMFPIYWLVMDELVMWSCTFPWSYIHYASQNNRITSDDLSHTLLYDGNPDLQNKVKLSKQVSKGCSALQQMLHNDPYHSKSVHLGHIWWQIISYNNQNS